VPMMMHAQVLARDEWYEERRALLFNVFGRLKPGVTLDQAQAAMTTLGRSLADAYPKENKDRNVTLVPLTQAAINPNFRGGFVFAGALLMTVVGVVLLIACANVASLLLARATARRREIAVRLSLGAGRGRLVRQLLTESLLLSLLGGAAGLVIAIWGRDLIWAYRPPLLLQSDVHLGLDMRVIGFTAALSILTGVIFGLTPAVQTSKSDVVNDLRERSGRSLGPMFGKVHLRQALVVAQVALSLILLIGAGLFVRSLRHAQQIDPGFDASSLLTLSYDVRTRGYDETHGREFHRLVRERLQGVAAVRSAAVASNVIFNGGGFARSVFIEGQEPQPGGNGVLVLTDIVGPGYFATAGIPLLKGRDFTEADRPGTPLVVIINEAMAKRFWPDSDAVGKRFKFFGETMPVEVAAVAANSKIFAIGEEPQPCVYMPLGQNYSSAMTLHVRTGGDPASALGIVRQTVQSLDAELLLTNVQTVPEVIEQSLWAPRMGAALLAIFGLLALILAVVGLYGVMAYSVSQRTHEIGIRMALGARRLDVLRLVVRQGLTLTIIGLGAGLVSAFALTRVLSGFLFGISATDPATFAATSLLMASVAALASVLPAARATRVDPLIALRYE
jgi:putative ABC transport system permease protein